MKHLDSALKVIKHLRDRLAPSQYKALRELGYNEQRWKNMTSEQASKIIAAAKNRNQSKTSNEQSESIREKLKHKLSSEAEKFSHNEDVERFIDKRMLHRTRGKKIPFIKVTPSKIDAAKELFDAFGFDKNKMKVVTRSDGKYLELDTKEYEDYLSTIDRSFDEITEGFRHDTFKEMSGTIPSFDETNDEVIISFRPREKKSDKDRLRYTPKEVANLFGEMCKDDYGDDRVKVEGSKIIVKKKATKKHTRFIH